MRVPERFRRAAANGPAAQERARKASEVLAALLRKIEALTPEQWEALAPTERRRLDRIRELRERGREYERAVSELRLGDPERTPCE